MSTERRVLGVAAAVALVCLTSAGAQVPPGEPQPERAVLGARSEFSIDSEETIVLPAGAVLRTSPSDRSPALVSLEADRELRAIEHRPGWVLVRFEDLRAWARFGELLPGEEAVAEEIPDELWFSVAPVPERLARVAQLLAFPENRELGSYRLITDLDPRRERDSRLLERLARLTSEVEREFRKRYGLELPMPPARPVIVLFRRQRLYRQFVSQEGAITESNSAGHASPGMMVLALEGPDKRTLDDEELAAVFVHELVHLLNQRAFLRELPPWLEEGMAEDFSLARVSPSGELDMGTMRGSATLHSGRGWDERGKEVHFQELVVRGPRLALADVVQRWSGLWEEPDPGGPDLVGLLELGWQGFALGSEWSLNYTESAFLLRYLFDGQSDRFAEPARVFLRSVRSGGPSDAPALARRLGVEIEELERGFQAWAAFQAVESSRR